MSAPYLDPGHSADERTADLLGRMTVEEKAGHMPRLAHAPVAGDIAADPRSIRSLGVLSPSRGPGERWISCANSENRSELARWAVLGPEVSIQTSHAYQ